MSSVEACVLAYLLNALWQAPMLLVLSHGVARGVRAAGVAWEHRVWVVALSMQVALPALAVAPARWIDWLAGPAKGGAQGSHVAVWVRTGLLDATAGTRQHDRWMTLLLVGYAGVTSYAGLRLVWGSVRTMQLRGTAVTAELRGPAWAAWEHCELLFRSESLQRGYAGTVRIAFSSAVRSPLTFGVRERWLLLPPDLLMSLGEADWMTLFAHEGAHMVREDFAKNLLYEAMMLPLAWHPAVWLTRDRLVESREWVCDAIAAKVTGGPIYRRSLLRLASLLVQAGPVQHLRAVGILDGNRLEERMRRLTAVKIAMTKSQRIGTLVYVSLMAVALCAPAWALGVHVAAAGSDAVQNTPTVYSVGGAVTAPVLISQADPQYTAGARKRKISGVVQLSCVVDTEGHPQNVEVVKSLDTGLDRNAIKSVAQYRFHPAMRNGRPVPVELRVEVRYQIF